MRLKDAVKNHVYEMDKHHYLMPDYSPPSLEDPIPITATPLKTQDDGRLILDLEPFPGEAIIDSIIAEILAQSKTSQTASPPPIELSQPEPVSTLAS